MTDVNLDLINVNRADAPNVILEDTVSYAALVAALPPVTPIPVLFSKILDEAGGMLAGTTLSEVLIGNDGADNLMGDFGDDILLGGAGNDILDGGRGSDLMIGGAGNDTLIADSDAGEPVIGQTYDPTAGRNVEINQATNTLYPNQPFVADDVMVGGSGADTFLIKPQINAKLDIILKHTDDDGRINWAKVAGENGNVHDHWVDSIGTDVIADYSKADGDVIKLYGHTVTPELSYEDVDGDGDLESILKIYSNQANGGAHDDDFLGQVIIHGDLFLEDDLEHVKNMETYGVVETVQELMDAISPTGVKDLDVGSTQSENPYLDAIETRDPDDAPNTTFEENLYLSDIIDGTDDILSGTSGDDVLFGDPDPQTSSALNAPISYWNFADSTDGVFDDAGDNSNATYYLQDNGEASIRDGSGEILTIPGYDGEPAALFGVLDKSFAYIEHEESFEVLNGTITAWFNPVDLKGGSYHTIVSKDSSGVQGGGHFFLSVKPSGKLYVRFAEGENRSDSGYNHEWITKANPVNIGQWQHIAATFGADGVTIYLNGQALADSDFTKIAGAGLNDSAVSNNLSDFDGAYMIGNENPFIVGANAYHSDATDTAEDLGVSERLRDFFEGGISDVGFWGGDTPADALDATQIQELFLNGPGDLSSLNDPETPVVTVSDDILNGEAGDDTLDGGAGDDDLNGGSGEDMLLGGYGNDNLDGGDDNDIVDGGHGEDVVDGGAGDDIILSRSDDREPVIAQIFDHSDDPYFEVSFDDRMLYPSQKDMASDDNLYGGEGADQFLFQILINAKERIINRHVNEDRTIDWKGVTGENKYVHDHWVDGIGNDVIHDFDADEGDTLRIEGHTTKVYRIEYTDANQDGSLDTVLHLWSDQGNAGAHNKDLLGTITVLDNLLDRDDFTMNHHANHGIVTTIDEYKEAVTPLILPDQPVVIVPPTTPPVTPPAPPPSGPNNAPVANKDNFKMDQDTALVLNVLANDSDPDGDALTITRVWKVDNGSVTINIDNTLTFTSEIGFVGEESFYYEVSDGRGGTATSRATILVEENSTTAVDNPTDNRGPNAQKDNFSFDEDTINILDVLSNDSDPDGDALAITRVWKVDNGSATINADNTITFEADEDFYGSESFYYEVTDGQGGYATAMVNLAINPVADIYAFDNATAFSQVEVIDGFVTSEGDALDLSDILSLFDPLSDAIADFVQVTDNGADSSIAVDADGGADNFVQIATLSDVAGLDVDTLYSDGNLIA